MMRVCKRCGDEYDMYDSEFDTIDFNAGGEHVFMENYSYCPKCAAYRMDARRSAHERAESTTRTETRDCPRCGGKGRLGRSNNKCSLCKGSGQEEYSTRDDIKLPDDMNEERKGGCFITSACVFSQGLSDDCLELKTLREYRDKYLLRKIEGEKAVREYYRVAPRIVRRINQQGNFYEIYSDLYENDILVALEMIGNNDNERAFQHYKSMVDRLKQRF